MANLLLISLTIFSLLRFSSSLPTQTVLDAAEILSNSGFVSMALTIELLSSETPIPQSPFATIFSPPDTAFSRSGQPPLSLLQFHFSPLAFSVESLKSLPYGTKIPTMSSGQSLVVTTSPSDDQISLNGVKINGSPIYDDGSLILFGIDDFFNLDFQASSPIQSPEPNFGCLASMQDSEDSFSGFDEASKMLRSSGYSIMASFLDLQLPGFGEETRLTVFAPVDEVMATHMSNYSEYSSLFLRHVVPCKLSWTDLADLDDGTGLRSQLKGFTINISRSGDVLMLNGVVVTFPNIYYSDWLVVHGLGEVLVLPERQEEVAKVSTE